MLVGSAVPRAEPANNIPVRVSALLRPMPSAMAPPISGPRMHPPAALLTAKPTSAGLEVETCFEEDDCPGNNHQAVANQERTEPDHNRNEVNVGCAGPGSRFRRRSTALPFPLPWNTPPSGEPPTPLLLSPYFGWIIELNPPSTPT